MDWVEKLRQGVVFCRENTRHPSKISGIRTCHVKVALDLVDFSWKLTRSSEVSATRLRINNSFPMEVVSPLVSITATVLVDGRAR
jgi:hypothetical protein